VVCNPPQNLLAYEYSFLLGIRREHFQKDYSKVIGLSRGDPDGFVLPIYSMIFYLSNWNSTRYVIKFEACDNPVR